MHRSLKARLAAAPIAYCALIIAAHAQTFHSNTIDSDASTIFRDYNTDGVSGSGAFNPHKSDFRNWGKALGSAVRVITPQNYGAACDGVTDDSTAMTAWAAALTAGVVGFISSPSTCKFATTLAFPVANGVTIRGEGLGSALLWAGGANITAITFGTTTGSCAGSSNSTRLSDFLLKPANTQSGGGAIQFFDTCATRITNLAIEDDASGSYGKWYNGLVFKGGNQIYAVNNTIAASNGPVVAFGDDAGHSSTQLTDFHLVGGIIIGGIVGVDIAGNVGGYNLDGVDVLGNQTEVRISQDFVAIPNLQGFFGAQLALDANRAGGAGRQIDITDPGETRSELTIVGSSIASANAECVHIAAGVTINLNWTGGQLTNCTTDGIKNESTTSKIHVTGVTVNMAAGFGGATGYAFNCAAANSDVYFKNINFIAWGTAGQFSSSCNHVSFTSTASTTSFLNTIDENTLYPLNGWQRDVSSQPVVTVANNSCVSFPAGSGTIGVSNQTSGDTAEFICGNGCALGMQSGGGSWVLSGTVPASGKSSVGANSGYKLCNNTGGSVNYNVRLDRWRGSN